MAEGARPLVGGGSSSSSSSSREANREGNTEGSMSLGGAGEPRDEPAELNVNGEEARDGVSKSSASVDDREDGVAYRRELLEEEGVAGGDWTGEEGVNCARSLLIERCVNGVIMPGILDLLGVARSDLRGSTLQRCLLSRMKGN